MLVFLNKAKTFFLFLFLFSLSQAIFSQNWSGWQTIYNANNLKVEVSFKLYNCDSSQKQSKYRCQISGELANEPKFLNWKMVYINCDNEVITQQNSLNIGENGDDGLVESMDNVFICQYIQNYFYDL